MAGAGAAPARQGQCFGQANVLVSPALGDRRPPECPVTHQAELGRDLWGKSFKVLRCLIDGLHDKLSFKISEPRVATHA